LSSRNARLNTEERSHATVLYRALRAVAAVAFKNGVDDSLRAGQVEMASEPTISVDYFGIADHDTLEPLSEWGERDKAVALIAAQVGPVRLIDNITLLR